MAENPERREQDQPGTAKACTREQERREGTKGKLNEKIARAPCRAEHGKAEENLPAFRVGEGRHNVPKEKARLEWAKKKASLYRPAFAVMFSYDASQATNDQQQNHERIWRKSGFRGRP